MEACVKVVFANVARADFPETGGTGGGEGMPLRNCHIEETEQTTREGAGLCMASFSLQTHRSARFFPPLWGRNTEAQVFAHGAPSTGKETSEAGKALPCPSARSLAHRRPSVNSYSKLDGYLVCTAC